MSKEKGVVKGDVIAATTPLSPSPGMPPLCVGLKGRLKYDMISLFGEGLFERKNKSNSMSQSDQLDVHRLTNVVGADGGSLVANLE